jgi:hypothetical protein
MTTGRLTPITDDHGDQFPGAVPARDTESHPASDERFVRMHPDSPNELESLVEESADASTAARRTTGRRTPTRGQDGRRPRGDNRLRRITRSSLERFDRYTLEVFNPGAPYRRSQG